MRMSVMSKYNNIQLAKVHCFGAHLWPLVAAILLEDLDAINLLAAERPKDLDANVDGWGRTPVAVAAREGKAKSLQVCRPLSIYITLPSTNPHCVASAAGISRSEHGTNGKQFGHAGPRGGIAGSRGLSRQPSQSGLQARSERQVRLHASICRRQRWAR